MGKKDKSVIEQLMNSKVTAWLGPNYFEDWRKDVEIETKKEGSDARRREIIFAVCYAESYLFECTRRHMKNVRDINKYYPSDRKGLKAKRNLAKKWKQIPNEVYEDLKLEPFPKIDVSDLELLMEFRNGLVHARASRPYTTNQPANMRAPFPKKEDLEELEPGWALKIVEKLVLSFPMPEGM